MRILFLASRFPYPLTQGDRLRAYNFLQHLSKAHHITLVTPIQSQQEYEYLPYLESCCQQIEAVPITRISKLKNILRAPLSTLPLQVTYYQHEQIQKKVNELLSQKQFDIVHTQLARMAPFVQPWSSLPKVLDFIDALSLNMARRAKQEKGLKSLVFGIEARRMSRYERQLVGQFDQCIISSPIDRNVIGDFSNLEVIANGVSLDNFPYVTTERTPNTIIFAGNMSYFPNINAVCYFVDRVLPLIRSTIPEVRFTIVGPNFSAHLKQRFLQSGVEITGFVPDVHAFLKTSTVAIAPMQSGSGIQNKVLEAMATGTPVVATSYGIGSLPVQSGQHLLIADSPQEFAQSVIQLLSDQKLHRAIAINARQMVEASFTWEQAVQRLETIYQNALCCSSRNSGGHQSQNLV